MQCTSASNSRPPRTDFLTTLAFFLEERRPHPSARICCQGPRIWPWIPWIRRQGPRIRRQGGPRIPTGGGCGLRKRPCGGDRHVRLRGAVGPAGLPERHLVLVGAQVDEGVRPLPAASGAGHLRGPHQRSGGGPEGQARRRGTSGLLIIYCTQFISIYSFDTYTLSVLLLEPSQCLRRAAFGGKPRSLEPQGWT